jgi:hypothetical protein
MIPLRRAFEEKRRLVIPVAAGLAINVVLFVGVVYPMRARVGTAERRQQAAEASARNLTYLRLQQLAEEHHLRTPHRGCDPEVNPKGMLRRVRCQMALEGSYDDVRRFIHDVETGTDFIVIDGVTLSQSGEAGGALQLTINLSTYYKYGE